MEDDDAELERYMAAFAVEGLTPALAAGEARAVLDLARVVAHTAERRFAPLSAYLAGLAAGAAGEAQDPEARLGRLRELVALAQRLGHG